MIEAVIKSSLILLAALGALPLLRRQSAATRHAALTVGLLCAMAVPVLTPFVPVWHTEITIPISPNDIARSRGLYARVQDQAEISPDLNAGTKPGAKSAVMRLPMAIWLWLSGTAIATVLLLAGAARIAWLEIGARPITDGPWAAGALALSRTLNLRRTVRLLQNDRGGLGTWGIIRPAILLPRGADSWPDDRLRVVLAHELAHVKRLDWLVQVLAEVARAVYWFNPLFWIACRRLRAESEHACDDVVLGLGIDAKDYAAHLLELARALRTSRRTWSPVLAMAQPPKLERRFVAMLNPSLNHQSAARSAILIVCVVAVFLTLPLAAMRASEPARQAVSSPPVLVASGTPAPKAAAVVGVSRAAAKKPPEPRPVPVVQGLLDGSLTGAVSDSTGAVIPGVKVTASTMVINAGIGVVETAVQTTVSGETGRFEFLALTPGQYSLKADLPGFVSYRKPWLEIRSSQSLKENIALHVGGIAETVTVTVAGQPRSVTLPAAGTPQRIRVGGNVVAANLVSRVQPVYPVSARDAGIEGTVHLQGIIGTDGTLVYLRVIARNNVDLANVAYEAVRQWRYRPTLLNNEPVEVVTDIDVEFKLAQ